jgi:hypothetical protein
MMASRDAFRRTALQGERAPQCLAQSGAVHEKESIRPPSAHRTKSSSTHSRVSGTALCHHCTLGQSPAPQAHGEQGERRCLAYTLPFRLFFREGHECIKGGSHLSLLCFLQRRPPQLSALLFPRTENPDKQERKMRVSSLSLCLLTLLPAAFSVPFPTGPRCVTPSLHLIAVMHPEPLSFPCHSTGGSGTPAQAK